MEILFISHKYPPSIGGMEKHAFELLTRLEGQNKIHPLIYDNNESRFTFFFFLKKRVKEILKKHPNIQLIYVNEGLLACFAAQLKQFTTIPIIATVHGLDVVFPNRIYQFFMKKQLQKLDALIAVSHATANACVGRGINSDKVFVINNGVDHDLADAPIQPDFLNHFEQKYQLDLKGKKILISMGRPVKRKGFSWFVQSVMPQLPKDVVLLLIGPRTKKKYRFLSLLPTFLSNQIEIIFSLFSDEAALKEGIQLLKNKDRVIELGKLPFAEVIQLLQLADVFVMPNIKVHGDMEGFGLVALESAICGTPVLASGIEGIQDAVQAGKNGWLLPPAAAEQWKEALQQILYSKAETKQFGLAARNYTLSHFSWGKMAATYHQIFSQFALK